MSLTSIHTGWLDCLPILLLISLKIFLNYKSRIYIRFLNSVSVIPRNESERYRHRYSLMIKPKMIEKYGYNAQKVDLAKNHLVNSGFLQESEDRQSIFITDKGKIFLEDFYCPFVMKRLSVQISLLGLVVGYI